MIELRVLRYFLTVAREGTISQATDILHITQPTLSRQLAQMESDLGVKLFRHQGRRLLLTSEGMLLRRRAEEIFELVDKTEQEEQLEGTVVVGHGEYRAMDDLADCMADFSGRYPYVRFLMFSAMGDVIKDRMDRDLIYDRGQGLPPLLRPGQAGHAPVGGQYAQSVPAGLEAGPALQPGGGKIY